MLLPCLSCRPYILIWGIGFQRSRVLTKALSSRCCKWRLHGLERKEDFWASTDPKSSLFTWTFPDSPHAGAFLSKAVNNGIEPITFVSHDEGDGAWQFLGDSMSESGGVLVCLHHPLDRDPSLVELADLPLGWYAERNNIGEPWVRRPKPSETSE